MLNISALHQVAFQKKDYIIDGAGEVRYIPSKAIAHYKEDVEKTAKTIYEAAAKAFETGSSDFKLLANISFDYTKKCFSVFKTDSEIHEKNFALFFRNALSVDCIKELFNLQKKDKEVMSEEELKKYYWFEIVSRNRLHYQFHITDIKLLPNKLSLPIGDDIVDFSQLKMEERRLSRGGVERIWSLDGKEVFKTDGKGVFKDYHFHGISGILSGTAKKPGEDLMHLPYIKKQATGRNHVWVCTALKNAEVPLFFGDHSFLGLEDEKGHVTFYGQFGTEEDVFFYNFAKHFKVGIESPDRYFSLPLTNYINTQVRKGISQEDFKALKSQFENDFKNNDLKGSFLRHNCTEYVVEKLRSIGLDVNTKISNSEWAFRHGIYWLLPKSSKDYLLDKYERLSELAKKVMHIVVFPFYLVSVMGNMLFWSASFFYEKDKANCDVNFMDIFIRPWNIYSNHPLQLYKWQLKQQQQELRGQNG